MSSVVTNWHLQTETKTVLKKIRDSLDKKMMGSKQGLIVFGNNVQRESTHLCPVDTGNMRSSVYKIYPGSGISESLTADFKPYPDDPNNVKLARMIVDRLNIISKDYSEIAEKTVNGVFVVEVGYTAFYSWIQHESPEFEHTVGQWKFLETALRNQLPNLLRLLAHYAKGGS